MPSFNGFLSEEFILPEQQEPKVERLNGVEYQTLEVKRITLFPQNTEIFLSNQWNFLY